MPPPGERTHAFIPLQDIVDVEVVSSSSDEDTEDTYRITRARPVSEEPQESRPCARPVQGPTPATHPPAPPAPPAPAAHPLPPPPARAHNYGTRATSSRTGRWGRRGTQSSTRAEPTVAPPPPPPAQPSLPPPNGPRQPAPAPLISTPLLPLAPDESIPTLLASLHAAIFASRDRLFCIVDTPVGELIPPMIHR